MLLMFPIYIVDNLELSNSCNALGEHLTRAWRLCQSLNWYKYHLFGHQQLVPDQMALVKTCFRFLLMKTAHWGAVVVHWCTQTVCWGCTDGSYCWIGYPSLERHCIHRIVNWSHLNGGMDAIDVIIQSCHQCFLQSSPGFHFHRHSVPRRSPCSRTLGRHGGLWAVYHWTILFSVPIRCVQNEGACLGCRTVYKTCMPSSM